MGQYRAKLHFVNHSDAHPWQMYTSDTDFIIHNRFFFRNRQLTERVAEIETSPAKYSNSSQSKYD